MLSVKEDKIASIRFTKNNFFKKVALANRENGSQPNSRSSLLDILV